MARTNVSQSRKVLTHEGGRADVFQKPATELERAVATCLLFENTFYEKGSDIAGRIAGLCTQVPIESVASLAIKARNEYKLRHVPLFLCLQLAKLGSKRKDGLVRETIAAVVQRPDEMGELISLYWKEKKVPLSAQIKKGLRQAFGKFSQYQFSKWNRDSAIKLRDVMFMVHPKPTKEREALYKAIAENTLAPADTWEVALSAGADKKEAWERLLKERKLGYIALLMNMRNMEEVGVDSNLIQTALMDGAPGSRALPFRFLSAAKHVPAYAQLLSDAMLASIGSMEKLNGSTAILIDVSGSMDDQISAKSELKRWEAAAALAILLREVTPSCRIFTFSNDVIECQNFRGIAMISGIDKSQPHSSTHLAAALRTLKGYLPDLHRLFVVTDEQSDDGSMANWAKNGYLCNVASYQPGLELAGGFKRINGWSERIVDWVRIEESFVEGK